MFKRALVVVLVMVSVVFNVVIGMRFYESEQKVKMYESTEEEDKIVFTYEEMQEIYSQMEAHEYLESIGQGMDEEGLKAYIHRGTSDGDIVFFWIYE